MEHRHENKKKILLCPFLVELHFSFGKYFGESEDKRMFVLYLKCMSAEVCF